MVTGNKTEKEAAKDDVIIGQVYKDNLSGQEVIPYFFDFGEGTVRFSAVGRSNEDRASSVDFMRRFTHFGPVSSMAEKQVAKGK